MREVVRNRRNADMRSIMHQDFYFRVEASLDHLKYLGTNSMGGEEGTSTSHFG